MSNIKLVKVKNIKVNNIKIGSKSKKNKKNGPPPNIEYLQSIVRNTKKEPTLDLTNTDMISNLLNKKSKKTMDFKVSKKPADDKDKEDKKDKDNDKEKEDKKDKELKEKELKEKELKEKELKEKELKDKDKEKEKEKEKELKEKEKELKEKESKKKDKDKKDKELKYKDKEKQKKIGKKTTTKSIMSFFSKEDQLKIKNKNKTKRVKKIISSNLNAPKIERKTKRNIYKMGIKKILLKDKKNRKELSKMSRKQLFNELIKNGIIDKESNAPDKVLKDLYQLFLLVEENISK